MRKDIQAAHAALDAERKILDALGRTIDSAPFASLIDYLFGHSHRAVLTGIGKSGHVARKIASTLASTGHPSIFMHPAEAAHGDMGMIAPGDMLIMLSNSGQTDELGIVADFCERHDLKYAIVTANRKSALAKYASWILEIPAMPEGCPIDKAPMASAIAQMAIGDAIAAALMICNKITVEDFGAVHHGGYLGKSIRTVAND